MIDSELAERLDRIESLLEQLVGGRRLRADDAIWVDALLCLLLRHKEQWKVAEIIAHADGRPVLFSLIAPYLANPRKLGKRLARCAGAWVGDRMLERLAVDNGAALYAIRVRGIARGFSPLETQSPRGNENKRTVG
ncbi:MAG TPA: hypothetical protein VFC24_09805 [Casimicrobiaceae bacterium]|nr:hypothetical protein [Casimicrobiaceae bacterium]